MNLINIGVSHKTAPVELLERLAIPAADVPGTLTDLIARPYVTEALVLSTCNRVEVYATVSAFHGGLADITEVIAGRAGLPAGDLAPHLFVNFDTEAVRHAFRVAAGLDSLVVGEPQILGQLRDAYALAAERDTAGRLIHDLMQQALRVGKRAHAETAIDQAGGNVVELALRLAGEALGEPGVRGRSALVVGAGSTGGLALAALRRHGAGRLLIANRDPERAARQAASHDATPAAMSELATAIEGVDLVVCATAADRHILTVDMISGHPRGPMVIVDLAVPRDVDPAVGRLPGVTLIDMEGLAAAAVTTTAAAEAVVAIVDAEVNAYRLQLRGADVAPTVAALRARADEVVAAELERLRQRRPDLTGAQRADVAHAIHRVVRRLLHQPSVRVRELAAEPGGDRYAEVLRDLFGLDLPPVARTCAEIPDVLDDRPLTACEGDA